MHLTNGLIVSGLAIAAMLATPGLAQAADSPRFELTPFVGARAGGGFDVVDDEDVESSVDLGSGASFGIDIGLYRDDHSFYELLYSTQTAELDSDDPAIDGTDLRIDYLHFGGTAFFPQQSDFLIPYLSLTIGATLMKPDGNFDSETKFSGSIGGGLRIPFNDNVALNLGVRGYLTLLNSNTDLFCVSNSGSAGCLVRSTGSTFFQGEGMLGISVRF